MASASMLFIAIVGVLSLILLSPVYLNTDFKAKDLASPTGKAGSIFLQGCMTRQEVANETTKCLFIYNDKVYWCRDLGWLNCPLTGSAPSGYHKDNNPEHICGADMTGYMKGSHSSDPGHYLDPFYYTDICLAPPEDCLNGVDDDLDGLIDCADSDCFGVDYGTACGSGNCTGTLKCKSNGLNETFCSSDGQSCNASCSSGSSGFSGATCSNGNCTGGNTFSCNGTENDFCSVQGNQASCSNLCFNGLDDDSDGKTDSQDPDCIAGNYSLSVSSDKSQIVADGSDSATITATLSSSGGGPGSQRIDPSSGHWMDTFVKQDEPGTNFGSSSALEVDGDDPQYTGKDKHALIWFDVSEAFSGIPAGATIQSALLHVYVYNRTNSPYNVFQLTQSWDSSIATWNNASSLSHSSSPVYVIDYTTQPAWYTYDTWATIDLTQAVQNWVNGQPNYGIVILDDSSTDGLDFYSSDNSSNKPYVTIDYYTPTGTVEGYTINYSIVSGTGTLSSYSGVTNASGQLTTSLSTTTPNQSIQVNATQPDFGLSQSVFVSSVAPPTITLVLNSDKTEIVADGSDAATITATLSSNGSPLQGETISFSISSGSGSISPTQGTTNASGQVTVFLSTTTPNQSIQVTAIHSVSSASDSITVTSTPAPQPTLSIQSSKGTIYANGTDSATVTAVLMQGSSGIQGETVNFSITSGNAALSSSSALTDLTGKASVTVTTLTSNQSIMVSASSSTYSLSSETTIQSISPPPECITRAQFTQEVSQGKCLIAVDSNVFDMTSAAAWDSTGHGGYGHLCGAFVDSTDPTFPATHMSPADYEKYFGKYFYSILCQEDLCGNSQIDAGENCSNCPADVQCGSGKLCCNASCQLIECSSDSECNDFNPETVDSCSNPGTCESYCSNTLSFTCYSKTKFNALVASGKCLVIIDNKVYDMTPALTWDSSGHYQHLCGSTINPNDPSMPSTHQSNPSKYLNKYYLTDLCSGFSCGNENCSGEEICCNNSCIQPVCSSGTDCNDQDPCTIDSCNGPNSCSASCENIPITNCETENQSLAILAPGTVVEGQTFLALVQAQGISLIEGATVSYGTQSVLTDENGSAELTAEPDANKITATKPGYLGAEFSITVLSLGEPREKELVLSLPPELIAGEPFKVIVRDNQGFLVPEAKARYGSQVKLTNESGAVVFQAKEGVSIVSVEKKGFASNARVSLPKKKAIVLGQDFTIQVITLFQLIGIFMLTVFSIEVLRLKRK